MEGALSGRVVVTSGRSTEWQWGEGGCQGVASRGKERREQWRSTEEGGGGLSGRFIGGE